MVKHFSLLALLTFLIFTTVQAQTVWDGPTITFSKRDFGNPSLPQNQDRITPTTWITRGNVAGIFNIVSEKFYAGEQSPANTEWATGLLEDYASLTYRPRVSWAQNSPPSTVGVKAVLHLIAEDIYIGLEFLSWSVGSEGGGGFIYRRTTPSIGTPVTFYRDADGDGYGDANDSEVATTQPEGYVKDYSDCNDNHAANYPGAVERCDGLDNDCSGIVDDVILPITSFTLVNAATYTDMQELKYGDVLDPSTLPINHVNIRANTDPATTGSVVFELNGPVKRIHTENLPPFALFGDDMKGTYFGRALPPGWYSLTATPYCGNNGSGPAGMPNTIEFKIINPDSISTFTSVNADTDTDIGTLAEGTVIDLLSLPINTKLNIRANTDPATVGSVFFYLEGPLTRRNHVENNAPYALFVNKKSDYFPWVPQVGDYTLTATPFSQSKGIGEPGTPLTIHFKIIYSAAVTSFTLVDAQTGKDIQELKNGDVLNLPALPTQTLNIRANTDPGIVGSVAFDLSGTETRQHIEKLLPYSLFANNKEAYLPWTPKASNYILSATPLNATSIGGGKGIPLSIYFTITNQKPVTCTTPSFTSVVPYPSSGQKPQSVASGDFNRDDIVDLMVSDEASNKVSVLMGKGDGSFLSAVSFPIGGQNPISIATGDFNNDGNLDLATANNGTNNISVLTGDGKGGFSQVANYGSGGVSPGYVITGDFNRDGKLDLAVSHLQSGDIGILLGKSDGTFATARIYYSGDDPLSFAAADLNRDGGLDLAVPSGNSNRISVLLGHANGSFDAPIAYAAGGDDARCVAITDFNRDGKLDLAVSHINESVIGILLGNGDGSFAEPVSHPVGFNASQVKSGDFNLDGKMDLAVMKSFPNTISLLLGNGDGSFMQPVDYAGSGTNLRSITMDDFDGDGKTDLAVAAYSNGTVGVLLNTCGAAVPPTVVKAEETPLTEAVENGGLKLRAIPNPLMSQTVVHFRIDKTGYVTLGVYNLIGAEVARLYQGNMEGGREYRTTFESKGLPAGVYILRLTTRNVAASYKMVLIH